MGYLHPDYRTNTQCRQNNIDGMKGVLKETLKLYGRMKVKFEGVMFTDGTKLHANATDDRVSMPGQLAQLEEQVKAPLREAEQTDT